ncbi:MAG TPA: hypothetical protein PLB89_18060 [Flavobacteriales bacterium]|nr:hypothetical protein [Flavobacteriales bacterium]
MEQNHLPFRYKEILRKSKKSIRDGATRSLAKETAARALLNTLGPQAVKDRLDDMLEKFDALLDKKHESIDERSATALDAELSDRRRKGRDTSRRELRDLIAEHRHYATTVKGLLDPLHADRRSSLSKGFLDLLEPAPRAAYDAFCATVTLPTVVHRPPLGAWRFASSSPQNRVFLGTFVLLLLFDVPHLAEVIPKGEHALDGVLVIMLMVLVLAVQVSEIIHPTRDLEYIRNKERVELGQRVVLLAVILLVTAKDVMTDLSWANTVECAIRFVLATGVVLGFELVTKLVIMRVRDLLRRWPAQVGPT